MSESKGGEGGAVTGSTKGIGGAGATNGAEGSGADRVGGVNGLIDRVGGVTVQGRGPGPVLITGGAGFIGTNLADRLASAGQKVIIYDNLSRPRVAENVAWLVSRHGGMVEVVVADIRDRKVLSSVVARASAVFHMAGQVAVTTSVADPISDFETNARGTLELLEVARPRGDALPIIFTSTNKVYGGLSELPLSRSAQRYTPTDPIVREHGIGEDQSIELQSPYGCSKGAADQYMLDYARTYGLSTIVFRMSCIYGPHQFGTEDQGWVAHFLIRALEGETITLYGDGMQVRDTLFIDDLIDAFLLALRDADQLSGQAFNIGGGPRHTISLLELIASIGELHGAEPSVEFRGWRVGDQRYYVSDTRRFEGLTGWSPRVGVAEGVRELYEWLKGVRMGQGRRRRVVGATH